MSRGQGGLRRLDYTKEFLKELDHIRNFFYLYRKKFFIITLFDGTRIHYEQFFEKGLAKGRGKGVGAVINSPFLVFLYEKPLNLNVIDYSNCIRNNSRKNISSIIFLNSHLPPIMGHQKGERVRLLLQTSLNLLFSPHHYLILFLIIRFFLPVSAIHDNASRFSLRECVKC